MVDTKGGCWLRGRTTGVRGLGCRYFESGNVTSHGGVRWREAFLCIDP